MARLDERSNPHRWRGVTLRVAGAVLLFLAWLAGSALQRRADGHHAIGLIDGGLALAAFLPASVGSAALTMGDRLFGRVMVASRWRRR